MGKEKKGEQHRRFLDVRIPIGLIFTLFGAIMVIYGLWGGKEIYHKSLNININFWWGLLFLLFGGVMLILSRRGAS